MTTSQSIDTLVHLPEEEAIQGHFDADNRRQLRRWIGLGLGFVFVTLLHLLVIGTLTPRRLAVLLGSGALLLVLALTLRPSALDKRTRRVVVAGLLVQFLTWSLFAPGLGTLELTALVFAILTLFFRLKTEEYLVLYGTYWGVGFLAELLGSLEQVLASQAEIDFSVPLIRITLFTGLCLVIAVSLTRRSRITFLEQWRRARSRSQERKRMRQELESARKIQLQMLPGRELQTPWLQSASLSLPASEVGGDYYDFFTLSESRVAVVVGDVAGHGVTSCILLSGVRSCLHLLHESGELQDQMLEKLDRVVRQTTDRRMFMTLAYVSFDRDQRLLRVSSAGHTPVLHYSAARDEVQEIRIEALPLGTPLRGTYRTQERTFAPGDVFVLYTDGISELTDSRGREYELDRLERILKRVGGRSPREIREALLNDLWTFKGDAEQGDDVTLVIIKPFLESEDSPEETTGDAPEAGESAPAAGDG